MLRQQHVVTNETGRTEAVSAEPFEAVFIVDSIERFGSGKVECCQPEFDAMDQRSWLETSTRAIESMQKTNTCLTGHSNVMRYAICVEACIVASQSLSDIVVILQEPVAMPVVLRMHRVERSFDSPGGSISILSKVDLELRSGEAIAIRGPSGCGKSTLLLIAGTLDTPTSGVVEIVSQNPWTLPARKLAKFRNQCIGMVFQEHRLLPQLSVLENVLVPLLAGFEADRSVAEQRGRELLNRVGLQDRLHHRPAALSGGERQRVAVCRALVLQPSLLLADEPTGNLDPRTADVIGKLLLEIAAENEAGLLCATHSSTLAESFPQQLTLDEGRLIDKAGVAG